tara:strand:+ start:2623 stop:3354 length:732 start_codon:yes stop_codon:yes gene_type:complete
MSNSFLVIGGSSDIGLILCQQLVENGYTVTILARDHSRVDDLEKAGARIIIGDSLNEDDVTMAVQTALDAGNGKISGIAHLVGSLAIRPPHAMDINSFEEVIQTNLTSSFITLSKGCKTMIRNGGGRIVFTSSVAASLGLVNHEAIAAAKGGVEAMVRSAAATYSKRGIRVNAVAPGLTNTRMAETILRSEASKKSAIDMIPMNRINQPEEVSSTIFWLLTNAPDNITGQIINVDGGMAKARS